MNQFFLLTLAAVAISTVSAFSNGAPEGVCADMVPKHPDPAQESESPYKIVLKKKSVSPGGSLSLVISSPPGLSFKGFFVQARVGDTPVGTFTKNPKSFKVINCLGGSQNAVTHIDAKPKSRITLTWIAPKDLSESVTFYATVAKNGAEYWVGQQSEAVTVA
uniref:Defense protein Hdd11-like n=1 Tax=Cacopsylla melanoneura TaxID=428564 RepID=A0A8D9BR75_9HEMI